MRPSRVDRIAPRAAEIDASHEFPWDVVEAVSRARVLRPPLLRGVRRHGHRACCSRSSRSRRSRGSARRAGSFSPCRSSARSGIKLAGSAEQRAAWLPRLASGEVLAAYALTEAGSGSDSASMATTARRDGDEWVLDGIEAVHHQRRRGGDLHRVREDRSRCRARRHLGVHRRGRRARVRGRAARGEARDLRLDDGRAPLRRLPSSRRATCSARRARASGSR